MTNTNIAGKRAFGQTIGQVDQFALGTAAFNIAIDQRCNPGTVIATIFKALEPFKNTFAYTVFADNPDNAAHMDFFPASSRLSF